jgi:RNA polymerase sigma factor (sigma-70 family)
LISALQNNLTELQQHVIVLRFLEGFNTQETAMIINRKANLVRAIQNRGLAKLRKALHLHKEKYRSNLSA